MDWIRLENELELAGLDGRRNRAHVSYLRSAHTVGRARLFADYLSWQRNVDDEQGNADQLEAECEALRGALVEQLRGPPSPLEAELIEALGGAPSEESTALQATCIEPESEHGPLARRYFELVTATRRREAAREALRALDNGLTVKELYLQVFQPCLREVGRLWQTNVLTVGEEHYFTAVTQSIMAQIYPRIFEIEPTKDVLVAASIEGNNHEIGIRMVADFFEIDGWDTHYLGADAPVEEIIACVLERRPRILAVSVALGSQLERLTRLVEDLRGHAELSDLRILVGGNGLLRQPADQRTLGADGFANDAAEALRVAAQLVGN